MKVLQVTNMYPTPSRPYLGVFVKRQVDAIRANGVETSVFFTDVSGGRRRYLRALSELRALLRDGRFDLVHAHHTYCVLQVRMAQPRDRHHPLVFTLQEGEAYGGPRAALAEKVRPPRALTYARSPKRLALRLADFRVSVEAGLPRRVGFAGPVEVIPPGTDTELFRPLDRQACRNALGLPQGRPVVFFPADPADPNKGFDLVRRSTSRIADPLLITGGSIPPGQMVTYLNASDVVVQASRYEAAPAVIREAMACGVPVVSTAAGDVRQLFGDTPGCFVTRPDPSELGELLERAISAPRDPAAGRARLRRLGMTLEDTTARHIGIYTKLVGTT